MIYNYWLGISQSIGFHAFWVKTFHALFCLVLPFLCSDNSHCHLKNVSSESNFMLRILTEHFFRFRAFSDSTCGSPVGKDCETDEERFQVLTYRFWLPRPSQGSQASFEISSKIQAFRCTVLFQEGYYNSLTLQASELPHRAWANWYIAGELEPRSDTPLVHMYNTQCAIQKYDRNGVWSQDLRIKKQTP